MSLDLREVIKVAREQFKELLPELSIESADIRLEEIEQEGKNWAVTFSVPKPRQEISLLGGMSLGRTAKVIVVDGNDGRFVALRQRAA